MSKTVEWTESSGSVTKVIITSFNYTSSSDRGRVYEWYSDNILYKVAITMIDKFGNYLKASKNGDTLIVPNNQNSSEILIFDPSLITDIDTKLQEIDALEDDSFYFNVERLVITRNSNS